MNMKSLRTQQQIETALFALIKNKPYTAISIAEITRKAKVSRTSFYRNYNQKDDVLRAFLDKQFTYFIKDIDQNKLTSLTLQLSVYLNYFKKHPNLMKLLLNAGFEGILLNLQTVYLKKLLTVSHPDLHLPDYAISYQSGGIYMLLVWWVKQNYQTNLTELVAYAEKHILLSPQ